MAIRAADLEVRVTADASQAKSELQNVQGQISSLQAGNKVKNMGEDLLGFTSDFVMVGADFSEQMTYIDKLIGGSVSHIEALKKAAINADIYTMFDAPEVAQGMEMLARAGFDASQIIGDGTQGSGLLNGLLYFASATKTNLDSAGRSFAAAMNIWKTTGMDGVDIANLLTSAILRSGKSTDQFMTGFQYVGSIATELGVLPKDLATVLSMMEQMGIQGRSAGTGLRTMFLAFADADKQQVLANYGIQLYDVNAAGQRVLKSIPDIITQFHTLLSTMDPDKGIDLVASLFGKPASSPLFTLFTRGAEYWDEYSASMDNADNAQEIMQARMATLKGSIEILKATWLGFRKVLGDSVAGYIKPVVDVLSSLVNAAQGLPKPILEAMAAVTALSGILLTLTGGLMIFRAVGGMKMLGQTLGTMAAVGWPVVAVLLAIGAAIALYKTNFGGFADFIGKVTDKWSDFKKRLHQGLSVGMIYKGTGEHGVGQSGLEEQMRSGFYNIVANSLAAIRDMGGPNLLPLFKALWPTLDHTAQGFRILGKEVKRFGDYVKDRGLIYGLKQLFAGDIGKDLLSGLGDIFSGMPRLFGTLLGHIHTGNDEIDGALRNLGRIFQLWGTVIEAVFDGNWGKAADALHRMFDRFKTIITRDGPMLWDWFKGVLDTAFSNSYDIALFTVSVLKWAFKGAESLYDRLRSWVQEQIYGSRTVSGPGKSGSFKVVNAGDMSVGTVALHIAGWAFTAAVGLAGSVITWVKKLWDGAFGQGRGQRVFDGPGLAHTETSGVPVGKIVLQIGGWLINTAVSIYDAVRDKVVDLWNHRQQYAAEIRDVGIQIYNWIVTGANSDVSHTVYDWIISHLRRVPVSFHDWTINILPPADKDITVDTLGIMTGLGRAVNTSVDQNKDAGSKDAHDAGHKIGEQFGKRFIDAIAGAIYLLVHPMKITIGGKTIDTWVNDYGVQFVRGFISGFGAGVDKEMTKYLGEPPEFMTRIVNWFKNIVSNIKGMLFGRDVDVFGLKVHQKGYFETGFGELLKNSFMSIMTFDPTKDIDWPDVAGAVSSWIDGQFSNIIDAFTNNRFAQAAEAILGGDFLKAFKLLRGAEAKGMVPDYDPTTFGQPGIQPGESNAGSSYYDDYYSSFGKNGQNPSNVQPAGKPGEGYPNKFGDFSGGAGGTLGQAGARVVATTNTALATSLNALAAFPPKMGQIAAQATGLFNAGIGAGMVIAGRVANLGAYLVYQQAQVPSLYNSGFSTGRSLGQGIVDGVLSMIGAIINARQQAHDAGSGESGKQQPFGVGGTGSSGITPKQGAAVVQNNTIHVSAANLPEFVSTVEFVNHLPRSRQIVTGNI